MILVSTVAVLDLMLISETISPLARAASYRDKFTMFGFSHSNRKFTCDPSRSEDTFESGTDTGVRPG